MGLGRGRSGCPNTAGIAGAVFTTGKPINIPYAYADLRFNPAFDKQTGYFTRSILCVPIVNKDGKTIGVTQVLNKRGGPFTGEDEKRLQSVHRADLDRLENAKLFDDVQNMKNYNEAMLQSMSNGVITLERRRAHRDLQRRRPAHSAGRPAKEILQAPGGGVLHRRQRLDARALAKVEKTLEPEITMDAEILVGEREALGQPDRAAAHASGEQEARNGSASC